MNNGFDSLSEIIRNRRTIKPEQFNGKIIPEKQLQQILALADWAPNHGNTEPWRFYIYSGDKVRQFCEQHASLYKANTDDTTFKQTSHDKFLHMGDHTSHVIIPVMRRGDLPKIPVLEEIAAASIATQHILLGAQALGIAVYWSSGGMTLQPPMKQMLQLREEDIVLGAIYLGYTDAEPKQGVRRVPLEEKLIMM